MWLSNASLCRSNKVGKKSFRREKTNTVSMQKKNRLFLETFESFSDIFWFGLVFTLLAKSNELDIFFSRPAQNAITAIRLIVLPFRLCLSLWTFHAIAACVVHFLIFVQFSFLTIMNCVIKWAQIAGEQKTKPKRKFKRKRSEV